MRKFSFFFLFVCAVAQTQQITVNNVQPNSKQGTTGTKFQIAGTVAVGAGNPLCTDINGNNTTSGCPTYESPISVGTVGQYWRGDKTWHTLDTSNVPENTSLYFTTARAIAAMSSVTPITFSGGGVIGCATCLVSSGSYTDPAWLTLTYAGGRISGVEPTITAGSAGKYWRYDKTWQTLDTSVVPENGNLYFTTSRVNAYLAGTTPIVYSAGAFSCPTCLVSTGSYSDPSWMTITWSGGRLTGIPTITNTFNGRSAAVVPMTGDYTWSMISGTKQGNTNTPQMAGTVAGVGVTLCTDANGNSTTSGCSVVMPTATTAPQYVRNTPNAGNLTTWQAHTLPEYDVNDYNFQVSVTGGDLAAGDTLITFTPVPLGINWNSAPGGVANSHWLYIKNGGSAAGLCYIKTVGPGTAVSGAATGNLTLTCGAGHTGAYTVQSATQGLQEAAMVAIAANASGGVLYVPAYHFLSFYAPMTVAGNLTIRGDGFNSLIQGQQVTVDYFDVVGDNVTFQDLYLSSTAQQTTGHFGIRIGNVATASNTNIHHVKFEELYEPIFCVRCSAGLIEDSEFDSYGKYGIYVANSTTPDNIGPRIVNNYFDNYGSVTAEAAVFIHSLSHVIVSGNQSWSDTNSLNWFLERDASGSGGQDVYSNNIAEDMTLGGIKLTGSSDGTVISGNTISAMVTAGGITGIYVNGSTYQNGSITGNAIFGYSSAVGIGINMLGTYTSWSIHSNTINNFYTGLQFGGTASYITVGPHSINNYNHCAASSVNITAGVCTTNLWSITFVHTCKPTYYYLASLGGDGFGCASPGSELYCSDCNSTCTAGSSTGRACSRENYNTGVWTH